MAKIKKEKVLLNFYQVVYIPLTVLTTLFCLFHLTETMAHASAMVSSSAPSVYSVQALVLLAEVGCWRSSWLFFVGQSANICQFDASSHRSDLGTSPGHGLPQRREGEGRSSDFPHHVLCLPLPEEPQVDVCSRSRLPLQLRVGD